MTRVMYYRLSVPISSFGAIGNYLQKGPVYMYACYQYIRISSKSFTIFLLAYKPYASPQLKFNLSNSNRANSLLKFFL